MEIHNNISATMKQKALEYGGQAEFAKALGIGRDYKGDPDPTTIRQMADGMGDVPYGRRLDLISEMFEGLHPSLYKDGERLWGALVELFRCSERRWEEGAWRYTVTELGPLRYGLKAEIRTKQGWEYVKESDHFIDDRSVAEAAAELFTRNALSPIHMEEAIEDYMKSI